MTAEHDDPAETEPAAPAATAALSRADWLQRIDMLCAEEGYLEPVGPRHHAWFHDTGPNLLVSFESLDSILARKGQMPFGHDLAQARGWSHLTIVCEGETWFRDPAVWGYFDRLVDDAFFEDFDQVLFLGCDICAYAACAYSVCAPGAVVLAVNPRATQDPSLSGWDRRHPAARRLDFTSRYGFAPDMTEGAARVHVIHDPHSAENAMHAAMFRRAWVHLLPARNFGDMIGPAIEQTGILPELVTLALEDRLTPAAFARLWRVRRRHFPYLKALLRKADASERPRLALMVCRTIVARFGGPRFRRRMQELEAKLGLTPAPAADPAAPPDHSPLESASDLR